MNGMTFGQSFFTDLDFADNVRLLAKLLDLLVPAIKVFATEAASLGLEVELAINGGSLQALGSSKVEPLSTSVLRKEVRVVEDFI